MATTYFINLKDVELEEMIQRTIHSRYPKGKVQVIVQDGYVNLLGSVENSNEKSGITLLVETIPGVQMVTNHIRVKTWLEDGKSLHF